MKVRYGLLATTLAVSFLGVPVSRGHALEDAPPVRTIPGSEPGVHADILSSKRTEGGLLTLRIAFANETGGEIKNKAFPGGGAVERIALFDFAHKRNTRCSSPPMGRASARALTRSPHQGREPVFCGRSSPPRRRPGQSASAHVSRGRAGG